MTWLVRFDNRSYLFPNFVLSDTLLIKPDTCLVPVLTVIYVGRTDTLLLLNTPLGNIL